MLLLVSLLCHTSSWPSLLHPALANMLSCAHLEMTRVLPCVKLPPPATSPWVQPTAASCPSRHHHSQASVPTIPWRLHRVPKAMAGSQSPAHSPASSASHEQLLPLVQSSLGRFSMGKRCQQTPVQCGTGSAAAGTWHHHSYPPAPGVVLVMCEVHG